MEGKKRLQTAVRWVFAMLMLTALAGLLMRAITWLPDTGLVFSNIRHAHSHLAFLGWVFGAYQLAFIAVLQRDEAFSALPYRRLFWAGQCTALLLFGAFLVQGYGVFTIALLTLHTVIAALFFYRFIRNQDKTASPLAWLFSATAIAAFLLSALGPFVIPLVKRYGSGDPDEARMAVHFYLHFHYNGWFVFGAMAILLGILKKEGIGLSRRWVQRAWMLLAAGLAPAYFINAPIALTPVIWDLLVAIVQWVGIVILIGQFIRLSPLLNAGRPVQERYWLYMAFVAFFLKYTLEILTTLPPLQKIIDPGNHYLVIGYLHLLFLGAVVPFMIWVALRLGWLPAGARMMTIAWILYGAGLLGTEGYLFSMGLGWEVSHSVSGLLFSSTLLAVSIFRVFLSALSSRSTTV